MTQPPDLSGGRGSTEASDDGASSQADAAAGPLIEHAEAGWRLGWDCLNQAGEEAEPSPGALGTAIRHLEAAVVDGIGGIVLRDPELFLMLGHLLLLVPGDAGQRADAAEEAQAAFADGLECPELDESVKLSLLEGGLLACQNRVTALEPGTDFYHPGPELAAARDELVAAAGALFRSVPPGHERASGAMAALMRAIAVRLIGHTGPDYDATDLLRLVRARPGLPGAVATEQAGTLALTVVQALMVAFEHEGDEDLLLAVAELVAEARSWPDLPSQLVPLLTLTLASAIVNSSESGALTPRVGEVQHLLDEAVGQLSADDPHLPQVGTMRAMLLHRLAARGQDPAMIDKAAREISQSLPQVPGEQRDGTGAMLTGLLGGVLDTRFRRRQDLRDIRTSLELTERAIASSPDTPIQRATLLGNRGVQLLRLAWAADSPGVTAGRALEALREAMAIVPAGSSLAYQLRGVLAAGLLMRAMTEGGPAQQTRLREAWEAARAAAGEEPPSPLALVVQIALAAVLGEADPQIQAAGEQAARRLQAVRSEFADRELPTELVDIASALLGGIRATRPGAGVADLDAALAAIEAQTRELNEPDAAAQLLGMEQARLLRHRDNLKWRQSLQAYQARPVTPDVEYQQLADWLERGEPDVSGIRELMAHGLAEQIGTSPDRSRSRGIGLRVLRGHALRVLLQSGSQDAITTARAAAGDSHEVVTWCLADGADDEAITALETGRALTLLAAGVTASVSDRLEAIGEYELAQAWGHSQDAAERERAGDAAVPEDVRHRVLDRLAASGDLAGLLRPPDREGLATTLQELGYDALIYLIPQGRTPAIHLGAGQSLRGDGGPGRPGGALMITDGGRMYWQDLPELTVGPESVVGRYLSAHHALLAPGGTPDDSDAWRQALERVCQWGWTAAIEPLQPTLAHIHPDRRARVVLVAVDALCVVPWHAAYPASDQARPAGERRYALDFVTFSYAASGALLSRIARSSPPILDSSVLLVGDPGGDLPYAQTETQALRAAFYPGASIWGEPAELTDAAATPARLRAALASAGHSLFHYAGHAVVDAVRPGSSALLLGDQRLRAEMISRLAPRESYCVCLAACTTHLAADAFDEAFTLSTAFFLGGASTVLGSLWRMKDAGTAVLMFLVHHYLSRGARPVDALHRAQMWMLNPDRRVPESMPAAMRDMLPGLALADPVIWAGLTHQGR